MLCGDWSVIKLGPKRRRVKVLRCRSWNCKDCQPRRRRQLLAQAAAGQPNKLLTLTINPRIGASPYQRLRILSHAWRVLVLRLRRRFGSQAVQYMVVVEQTRAGEPHLHILLRAPFIQQAYISEVMRELADSPIVDIRAVRDVGAAIRYVAKYITKAPAQFETAKRYWQSAGYQLPDEEWLARKAQDPERWLLTKHRMTTILAYWLSSGWAVGADDPEGFYAEPRRTSPPKED